MVQDKIRTLIEGKGGVLDVQQPSVLKNIAYPIKKQGTVFMENIRFYLSPENTSDFSAKLRGEKSLLRYMLVTKKETTTPKKPRMRPTRARFPAPKLSKAITPKKQLEKQPKVEIEKLEEKLEELLGK